MAQKPTIARALSSRYDYPMSRTVLVWLLLVLAFMGIADAWYLAASALSNTALSCDLGAVLDGCNIVAKSQYSHFLGLPLALYGVGFYAVTFVLSALLLIVRDTRIARALYLLSIVGALASVVFLAIQFTLIQALCIYCIASAVISFLIFFVSRDVWRLHRRQHTVTISTQSTSV